MLREPTDEVLQFQSLFLWNALVEWLVIHGMSYTTVFQSLFLWNALVENIQIPGKGKATFSFNPCFYGMRS